MLLLQRTRWQLATDCSPGLVYTSLLLNLVPESSIQIVFFLKLRQGVSNNYRGVNLGFVVARAAARRTRKRASSAPQRLAHWP